MSWQQQLLYKQLQLQELHRQQQQQQQNQQQNQMTEMPSWQNNAPPQMTNPHMSFQGQMTEMPSSWPNMVPNPNPQMLFPQGNMNWAQYGMNMNMNPALMNNFQNGMLMQQNSQSQSQSQLQPMRNMGMMPQQMDPSIYQTSQFLPMSSNNNNNTNTNNNNEGMMNKSGAQSDAYSPYQQAVPDQGYVPDTAPQNTMQNFLGGSSFTNPPAQSKTGGSSLDPEEEKLLYGDDNWIGSFGKSVVSSTTGGGFVNSVNDEGNNNNNSNNFGTGGGGFGSLQSGSWSALMQDALEVSSSEPGQNEEWSGLTVRSKNEPVQNQSAFQQNSGQFSSQNQQEQSQLGNGIWGQDGNSNNGSGRNSNLNAQFMQRGGQQGVWVPQQSRQQGHNFTNQNQAGNNSNNKTNGWNSNNALAQHGDNNNNNNNSNNNNIYGMQPPKNYMSKNQEISGQRRQDERKEESPILFPNPNPNPNPNSVSSGGFSPAQLGMQMGQNVGGNLGMNFGAGNNPFGSSFPLLQSQLSQQQQMVKSQQEQQQRFNEPLAQHSDKRDEELNSRGGVQSKDTLFNGAIPLFSQNRIGQPSQNMLELFQKAEKPPKPDPPIPDQSAFDTSSPNHPPQNHQHMQNFGLMLGPPSQRQQQQPTKSSLDPDHHAPIPSSSNSQGENNTDNTDLQNRAPKEPAGTGIGTNAGTMFKNVWTNVSTQPRNKIITPSIVQSMMLNRANSNINDTNSAGTGTGQAEAGTSSASSAQEERQLFDKNALNAPVGSKRGLSSDENILHGRPLNTNAQQNNYSLLNQVQSMRSTDLDAGTMNRLAKRLRPDHGGTGAPPVTDINNNNNKTSVGPHGGMMNFVSREKSEEKSPAGAPSPAGEPTKAINPQMAPSWFEQYGNYRNGQNISSSTHESPQKTGPAPHFSFPKVPWNNLDNNNIKNNSNINNNIYNSNKMGSEHGMERSPVTPISRFGPQTVVPVHNNNINININNSNTSINNIINNNAVPIPTPPVQSGALAPPAVKEKRKTGTRKMVPFHKVTEVPESIISTSMAEMDWAQTANRLFDKVDDEAELAEEGQLAVALSRRRLVFTTKLTQHLVPAVPPRFLRAKADSSFESVVYFASNFALRDACSLIHSSKNDASDENNNSLAEKSEKGGEQFFTKVVEASNGRFKKLEEDFIRLNKRTSVLDLQLECQELERFSIVNRLGRFHGRGHSLPDNADPSASRPFFQRALTPFPLPNNSISDPNTHCLSL